MFKFTIRELLLLTLVFGMGIGWIIDNRTKAAKIEVLRDEVRGLIDSVGVHGVILPDGEVIRATGYDGPVMQGRG